MSDSINLILKKLDAIEERLKKLEIGEKSNIKVDSTQEEKRDPLFNRAWEIILKETNDVSSTFLAKQLNIDIKRAEAIMDQLEEAGFGICYTKEV